MLSIVSLSVALSLKPFLFILCICNAFVISRLCGNKPRVNKKAPLRQDGARLLFNNL